jgi:hypothetical protein
MRVSELLTAMATWLESPENEALLLAEYNTDCLNVVAESCVSAAAILRAGAEQADLIEPTVEPKLTAEALDHLNMIITAFDASGDADLQKTASTIDELLLTVSAPPDWARSHKQAQMDRLEVLKNNYEEVRKQHNEFNGVKESAKAIEKSPFFKEVRIQDHALNTRTCPDHPGAQMARVGEHMFQCSMDKKVFNYTTGYTTERGEKVSGQEVTSHLPEMDVQPRTMFDTREDRIMGHTP